MQFRSWCYACKILSLSCHQSQLGESREIKSPQLDPSILVLGNGVCQVSIATKITTEFKVTNYSASFTNIVTLNHSISLAYIDTLCPTIGIRDCNGITKCNQCSESKQSYHNCYQNQSIINQSSTQEITTRLPQFDCNVTRR